MKPTPDTIVPYSQAQAQCKIQ